jgi:flagellar assembly protein FliH
MKFEPLNFKEFGESVNAKETRISPFAKARAKLEEPPPPPPPPTFSEEQLAIAKRDAYQEGFLAGIQDGIKQTQSEQADVEKLLMERLEKFAESISPIFESYKAHCKQLKNDMPPLALAIAKKVANVAIQNDHEAVIDAATHTCAEAMISEPNVTITINESLAGALSTKLQTLSGKVPASAHIEVLASAELPHGDYKIEWKNGGIERSRETLWQQLDKAIGNMLATIENEKEEQLELLGLGARG